jgi:hypothetical protein
MTDYDRAYRMLGLEKNATLDEIEEAFLELKAVWHPDRFTDDPTLREKAEAKQSEIEDAYRSLLEARSRKAVSEAEGNARGPSILDDTLSERMGKSKQRFPIWIALFGLVAIAVIISFFTWSPVEVEEDSEPSETEKIVAETRAAAANDVDVDLQESTALDTAEDEKVELPVQSRQLSPPLPAPPAEPVQEPREPPAVPTARVPDATPAPKVVTSALEKPTQEPVVEASDEPVVEEEPAVSELAERSFQILRAKSDLANQLVEGAFSEYSFKEWKAVERSTTEVYVDLVAEVRADNRDVHFVWAVDVEAQSVKPMSQAARDLLSGER